MEVPVDSLAALVLGVAIVVFIAIVGIGIWMVRDIEKQARKARAEAVRGFAEAIYRAPKSKN